MSCIYLRHYFCVYFMVRSKSFIMILSQWLDNQKVNNPKKMDSSQRQKNIRQRLSNPNINIMPFKISQSIVAEHFDLSSPTVPLKIETPDQDVVKKTSIEGKYKYCQQTQIKTVNRINPSERQLVSHLAKIFITQQDDKPEKVLIRIKEMSNSPESKQDRCRLEKFQICRIDRQNQEINEDEEGLSINPFFSFCEIPQISKIVVSQKSALRSSLQEKIIQETQSNISPAKIRQSKIDHTHFQCTKTVDLRYKPYPKTAYYSKFKAKSQISEFSSKVSSQLSPCKDFMEPKIDPLQTVLFTKLVQLDLILSRAQIEQKSENNRQKVRAVTLQQYEQQKKKYNEAKTSFNNEIFELRKEKDKMAKEIKQLQEINNGLKEEIKRLKDNMEKMYAAQKRILENNKKSEEELNEAKKTIKMLRRQLCTRQINYNSESNAPSIKHHASVQFSKKEEINNNSSPKRKDQPIKVQGMALKMIPTTNSNLPTQRETFSFQQNHYQQATIENLNSQNRQLNLLVQSHLYDQIANPLVQQEIRNYKAHQGTRRPPNMVGIRKNVVSREVTPNQSRQMLRTNKSAGRIEHFTPDSDSDNKSYSICSNLSKRSLYQRIGYVKKERQTATKQSILEDYMLKSQENCDFESQASQIKKIAKPENEPQKNRFKYKSKK